MASAETIEASSQIDEQQDSTLAAVRRRVSFLLSSVIWVLAIGGLVVVIRILGEFQGWLLTNAINLRETLGFPKYAGTDWYSVGAMLVGPLLTVLATSLVFLWWSGRSARQLRETWRGRPRRRLTRVGPLPSDCLPTCDCRSCFSKLEYVRQILSVTHWAEHWPVISEKAGVSNEPASTLRPEQYDVIAQHLLAHLEKDIAARALTAGLIVGVSQNRFLDLATIVVANFEIQSYVLNQLGKRPTLRLWILMLKRSLASIMINAYLNRRDIFAVNVIIKKVAMGLHVSAGALESAEHHLQRALDTHVQNATEHVAGASDHHLHGFDAGDLDADEFHLPISVLKMIGEVGLLSFSVGTTALNQLGNFIEHYGNNLVQGALAGGILYWHGIDLAADVLARTNERRRNQAFHRTMRDCTRGIAVSAGEVLHSATRQLRTAYRERRQEGLKSLPGAVKNASEWLMNFLRRN